MRELFRDRARALHHLVDLETWVDGGKSEVGQMVQEMVDFRSAQQCLGGNAAPVETDAAELVTLHDRRLHAELRRADRRDIAAWAAADDDNIEGLVRHFLLLGQRNQRVAGELLGDPAPQAASHRCGDRTRSPACSSRARSIPCGALACSAMRAMWRNRPWPMPWPRWPARRRRPRRTGRIGRRRCRTGIPQRETDWGCRLLRPGWIRWRVWRRTATSCRAGSVILKRCSSFSYVAKSRIRRCSDWDVGWGGGAESEGHGGTPSPTLPRFAGEGAAAGELPLPRSGGGLGRGVRPPYSQQQTQRVLDDPLELAQPLRSKRAIHHAMIHAQRARHHSRDRQRVTLHHRPLLSRRNGQDRRLRRIDDRGELRSPRTSPCWKSRTRRPGIPPASACPRAPAPPGPSSRG